MLYDNTFIKDNCGFGLIAHIEGETSHKIVRTAIHALARMQHRGAILSDGKTGDGCGLLLQMPTSFFRAIAADKGWQLAKNFAVGTLFLSRDEALAQASRRIVEEEIKQETLSVLGWRTVAINVDVLGDIALSTLPDIQHLFINTPVGWRTRDVERRLYMARRRIEQRIQALHDTDFYICSLSSQVNIYKGLCRPSDLPRFYPDLADLRMETAICLFHQRFSTNTVPRWQLAQPFRYLAHNGEINTITANRQWAQARAYKFTTPLIPDLADAAPFVNTEGSDSSAIDNMLELFLNGGMDLVRAMRLLVPPAWQKNPDMDEELRAFFDFNSMHMEPWDGPAGIVLSDGRYAACSLDRNGLRPARYVVTKDKLITVASEVGIWDYQPDEVVEKGRVGPGELLVIDTLTGHILPSVETDNDLKGRHPYQAWLRKNVKRLAADETLNTSQHIRREMCPTQLLTWQKQFAYSMEELEHVLRVLGENGQEAVGSMGDDTPLAVLSAQPRSLYDYFRQQFAQVTNPPLDPLRESHVMSLATCIGREMNVFCETEGQAHRVSFSSPILLHADFQQLITLDNTYYRAIHLDCTYDPTLQTLARSIDQLCEIAIQHVHAGIVLLILSDRNIAKQRLPIPIAMAVGAIHSGLVENNLRCDANIIVATASARDPHHFAVLIGFGATAIYPYLAYETLASMVENNTITKPLPQVLRNYRQGINKGLYKIMSKMGISTISSYRCSRLFEAVGLHEEVVERCFRGVKSRISGTRFADVEQDLTVLAQRAWQLSTPLSQGGLLKFTVAGEYHCWNPDVVFTLQRAVMNNDGGLYQRYAALVNQRPVAALRDLLKLKQGAHPLAVDEVEPAAHLFKRFDTAAMSIGALGPEAHEALAEAMNMLGGYSNSGEGGEDPARYATKRVSRIKQVASGRFGVTPHYLMSADVIQIKVAQGAKPGEGGQLPGDKVTTDIARLRFSVPGVTLISPPPHHDIYSIEDLAQLIFDLKQINPHALISVKLVAAPGVGTIATGVAKAYADLITIAGYDGGTGASPLSSVKYAGCPWELGLVETQQALVANGLRHKIRLQVDGGLKTGLDIVKAAILGAESFGFGTAPMVALGCKYLRICHLNNCATGIATQDEKLRRKHFHGTAARVQHFFQFIAEETRHIMASLGVKTLTDLIGRTDLLTVLDGTTTKQRNLDLSALLVTAQPKGNCAVYCTDTNPPYDPGRLNQLLLEQARPFVETRQRKTCYFDVHNTDRAVGATLSGVVANRYGEQGVAAHPIRVYFNGTAGQSFGVWNAPGIELILNGDANDYVGKGMAGGLLVIHPPVGSHFCSHQATIAGNTCLYGATGGKLFAAGCVGERFAVRNSGATTVVEGIGDNGCEYMTGGIVCILGKTGVNFGAGMTGGFAYVLDEDNAFAKRVNGELVEIVTLELLPLYQEHLRGLINEHVQHTSSARGEAILSDWAEWLGKFRLVKPRSSKLEGLLGQWRYQTQISSTQAQ